MHRVVSAARAARSLPASRPGPEPPEPPDHRVLRGGTFWTAIPGFSRATEAEFRDPRWQARNSVTSVEALSSVVADRLPAGFLADVEAGLRRAPMGLRLSPYVLSLIDWDDPWRDPLRRQFVPAGSEQLPDHPLARLDALQEQADSPVPGLVHRYPDKVLFLALQTCPVYCRFCTRSYAVGRDHGGVIKARVGPRRSTWEPVFDHLRRNPQIEDVVVSGGDVWQLPAEGLREIGRALLDIEHIRRIRLATRGLAVMPMKIEGDPLWTDALCGIVQVGRQRGKEVAVHTHVAHPNEITALTQRATDHLFQRGATVRNQCVLLRGVNDDPETLRRLVRRLSWIHVRPFYVYHHDLVAGLEDMRTSLAATIHLEKQLRGATAGYATPLFVVDLPGGGGKRDAHSFEHYDRETGISVFSSPNVSPSALFCCLDPVDLLSPEGRERWMRPQEWSRMIDEALLAAGGAPLPTT